MRRRNLETQRRHNAPLRSNATEHIGTDTEHGSHWPILGFYRSTTVYPYLQSRYAPSNRQFRPKPGQLGTRLCTQLSAYNANSACRDPVCLVPSLFHPSTQELVDLFCTLVVHNSLAGTSSRMMERGAGAWGRVPTLATFLEEMSEYMYS
jgi:hypothetical protein